MEQGCVAHELHNSARKYYRSLCLSFARCLSYVGKSLEPYTTQNQIITLVTQTDQIVILHLPNNQKRTCRIHRFRDGMYVAYTGLFQKELVNVKQFHSYLKNASQKVVPKDNFQGLVAPTVVAHKIELNYIDPLKEYLKVVYDEDQDEIMDIYVDIDEPTILEPTFEDVMTLWIAVMIWGTQLIVDRLLYKKFAFKITGKIYGLIQ
ncbi:4757_t:CDS:2 [Funneliformis geosporum]|uniref:7312_t:CDS:1 n=1 Tax=Funneliformis geosporum TaxID=1117311 RepID=A0A9W4SCV0_9GLOM|nr:4757_t:CDS:2 [Funneliformis geosporum]CAI2165034.1 7312_t:CDS:2 [Funneliformis geosporum]